MAHSESESDESSEDMGEVAQTTIYLRIGKTSTSQDTRSMMWIS
ncbi:MAG: hypothetical protein RIC07_36885 [Coleofasciculus sp. E1-EBD-02]